MMARLWAGHPRNHGSTAARGKKCIIS